MAKRRKSVAQKAREARKKGQLRRRKITKGPGPTFAGVKDKGPQASRKIEHTKFLGYVGECIKRMGPTGFPELRGQRALLFELYSCPLSVVTKTLEGGRSAYNPGPWNFWWLNDKDSVEEGTLRSFLRSRDFDDTFVTLDSWGLKKFTVGNKYFGRERQAEFHYFNLMVHYNAKSLQTGDNYFAIEYRDDGATWISIEGVEGHCPLTTVVSINGDELGLVIDSGLRSRNNSKGKGGHRRSKTTKDMATSERRLEFGDIITLSVRDGITSFQEKLHLVFMGSGPSTKNTLVKGGRSRIGGLLENPLILEKVLHFLSTKTVKDFRLVSKFWNSEGLKNLRDRVRVSIFRHHNLQGIPNYIHSAMNPLKFPHWGLTIPYVGGKPCQKKVMTDAKVQDDLDWLFLHSHNVTSLYVSVGVHSRSELKMLKTILRGVAGTLTTLSLNVRPGKAALPVSLEELRSLKDLSLSTRGAWDDCTSLLEPFLDSFLPAVQNIDTLRFEEPSQRDYNNSTPLDASACILQGFGRVMETDPAKFANLTTIVIIECLDIHLTALTCLREGSLKTLDLGRLDPQGMEYDWCERGGTTLPNLRPAL